VLFQSCAGKDDATKVSSKKPIKTKAPVQDTVTPVCKLKLSDIIGNYGNKSGFSASIKLAEKDSSKIDFVFQISKGCVRRYAGTASKEEFYSETELNFMSRDTINKVEVEISMFFSEGKVAIAERTSSKKDKLNDKCVFEGHLTKLK
jgi:hypothetical protein